jgi:hypothetical protein
VEGEKKRNIPGTNENSEKNWREPPAVFVSSVASGKKDKLARPRVTA